MSADNYFAVRNTTDDRFAVRMEFASDDQVAGPITVEEIEAREISTFDTRAEALEYAHDQDGIDGIGMPVTEYGVQDFTGQNGEY